MTDQTKGIPVVVSTKTGGVIFGYTSDVTERPIILTASRMCLYWDSATGGMWGLAERGPSDHCKISAQVNGSVYLEGVVSILSVDSFAAEAWTLAKIQGRDRP